MKASSAGEDRSAEAAPSDPPLAHASPTTSRLRIDGNGLSFERQIPDWVVLQVMRLALGGDKQPETRNSGREGVSDSAHDQQNAGKQQSLAEYYRLIAPSKIAEKLVTIGQYLSKFRGQESFSADDVRSAFRTVRESLPGNLPRDLKATVSMGWLDEERDSAGQYFVTLSGEQALEASFSSDTRPRSRKKVRKSSTRAVSGTEQESGDE